MRDLFRKKTKVVITLAAIHRGKDPSKDWAVIKVDGSRGLISLAIYDSLTIRP